LPLPEAKTLQLSGRKIKFYRMKQQVCTIDGIQPSVKEQKNEKHY
jgi:hypothetical protein